MSKSILIKIFSISAVSVLVLIIGSYLIKLNHGIKASFKDDQMINEFAQNDSLKLKSLNFLLENAEDKYSIGNFLFKEPDLNFINKEYLFQDIELSISKSKKRLDEEIYTLDQFLNYILPYRLRNEKIENWRSLANNKFQSLYDDDIFKHAKNINNELKKTFVFTGSSRVNKTFSDLLNDATGTCNEMSDLAAFSMRANGIAVAIDFAKWSNIRSQHQWNSLITKDKNIPFMGSETNPKPYKKASKFTRRYKRFAKVYRKTFKKYDDKFREYNPKKIISDVNYIDVTKEYCPDCKNLVIKLENEIIDNEVFFLCVYEVNDWVPVGFTYAKNNILTFKEVCPDNIFMLKRRADEKLEYFKTPFSFNQLGQVSFIKTDFETKRNLILTYDNSNERELIRQYSERSYKEVKAIKDSILQHNITGRVNDNTNYKLYYWNNQWIFIDEQPAKNGSIRFDNTLNNALYKLEETNDAKGFLNRCFTIDDNNNQNWW